MRVVFYDPASGRIANYAEGSIDSIAADGRAWLEVDQRRDDYDVRFRVADGALVALPPVVATIAEVEALLLARIDGDRELRQAQMLTQGEAKKYAYNRKAAEAIDSRALGATALNALGVADRRKRFPFAQAEATLTGETIAVVLARYDAALTSSAARVASLEAIAVAGKRAIRAATTIAAKQAAASAISWST